MPVKSKPSAKSYKKDKKGKMTSKWVMVHYKRPYTGSHVRRNT